MWVPVYSCALTTGVVCALTATFWKLGFPAWAIIVGLRFGSTFVEGAKSLFLFMKGGCRRRFVRAWVTDREAMAGLLATDAVRMRCNVQASATSVHNNLEHVALVPHAFEAGCAVLTRCCRVGSRVPPRPAGGERARSEERVDRKLERPSVGWASRSCAMERDSIVAG